MNITKSKTDQAIAYMNEQGVTAYAAAMHLGITPSAIYARLKVLKETASHRCECCGQLLPTKKETV